MKKWIVTHSNDFETFNKTEIEGKTYTDAYVNFIGKYRGEMIAELQEKDAITHQQKGSVICGL